MPSLTMAGTQGDRAPLRKGEPRTATDGKVECSSPRPARPRFWTRHRAAILLAALVLYTLALAVAVADEVLHLGFFPTPMEREARELIDAFGNPDPEVRSVAVERFFQTIEGFVAVPELIRALSSASPQRRAVANDCLKRLTHADQGFDPSAPPADRRAAIARWRAWWNDEANRRRF